MGRRTFIAGNGADRFPEGQRAAKPIGRILKRGGGYKEEMAIGMEGRRESEKRDEIFLFKRVDNCFLVVYNISVSA